MLTTKSLTTFLILTTMCIVGFALTAHGHWQAMLSGAQLEQQIFFKLHLPRMINAFLCGAALTLAGCLLQVLLRNPLADPYLLGSASAASLGQLIGLVLGFNHLALSIITSIFALVAMTVIFLLAQGSKGFNHNRLLLTGVVMAMGFSALISFILIITPNQQLPGLIFWLMGDLNNPSYPIIGLLFFGLAWVISLSLWRPLNLLAQGEMSARSYGVDTQKLQILLYFLSALLTAVVVNIAGTIGFVGLIIPHLTRLLATSNHKILLPSATLLGGSFLLLADNLTTLLVPNQQLPVGIITTLIGAPIFLFLMAKQPK